MFSTRPRALAAGVLAISLSFLAACGSEDGSGDEATAGLESVTIEGKVGKEPKVTFDGELASPKDLEVKVLTEGDGETVKDGDTVTINFWVGNGFTQEEATSTYDQQPLPVELTADVLSPLREATIGQKVGARVAVLGSAEDSFGEGGNSQIGIGNKDSVLFVIDIVDRAKTEPILEGPEGKDKKPAAWAPTLIEEDGVITGLDFSKAHEPGGKLLVTTLIKGDGAKVESGQTLHVRYLGQVYNAKKPFDESYSKGEPVEFPIGVGQVVSGWDKTLVGRTIGSRVIVEIPPNEGYGKKGNEGAGIKGTDTIFFVVDILGAR